MGTTAGPSYIDRDRVEGRSVGLFAPLLAVAVAVALRLVFFHGPIGSDEVVYLTRGYQLLHGELNHSNYIGSIRYGINLAEALSLWLFGAGIWGADGLYFVCSLGEVLLAYFFARTLWGSRAAFWSALAMAVLPIDVTQAGSLDPDCYLALAIAGSIILFWYAEESDRKSLYLAAGLVAGWVFWIKEAVILFGAVFPVLALYNRKWRAGYWWFIAGGIFCLLSNLIFFYIFYGDAFYVLHVLHVKAEDTSSFIGSNDEPLLYFKWLLVAIYHAGLLGWFAFGGAVVALCRPNRGANFVLIWAAVLLLVFSFLPVAFSPFEWIPKQSNYMLIFAMPLVLLAGWFLGNQRSWRLLLLGAAMISAGVVFSAMEQQVARLFSANGAAAAAFAAAHPGTPVYGPTTAIRFSRLTPLLHGEMRSPTPIHPDSDLRQLSPGTGSPDDVVAYVIDDPQVRLNKMWVDYYSDQALPPALRHCLIAEQTLAPPSLGFGRTLIGWIRQMVSLGPEFIGRPLLQATDPLWQFRPARVLAVTRACLTQSRAS